MNRAIIRKYLGDFKVSPKNVSKVRERHSDLMRQTQLYLEEINFAEMAALDYGFVLNDFYKMDLESRIRLQNYMYFITCGSYSMVFSVKHEKIAKFYIGNNLGTGFDNEIYISSTLVEKLTATGSSDLVAMVNSPIAYDLHFDSYFIYYHYIIHVMVLLRMYKKAQGHQDYAIRKENIADLLTSNKLSRRTIHVRVNDMVEALFPPSETLCYTNRKIFTNILQSIYEDFVVAPLYMFSDLRKIVRFLDRKNDFFHILKTSHVLIYDEGVSAVRDKYICEKFGFIDKERYFKLLFLCTSMFLLTLVSKGIHFIHNDLKPDNILVFGNYRKKPLHFQYQDMSFTVREKLLFKISDFGLSYFANDPNALNNKDRISNTNKDLTWRDDISKFMEMFNTYFEIRIKGMGEFYKRILEYNKLTDNVDKNHLFIEMLHSSLFDEWRDVSSTEL